MKSLTTRRATSRPTPDGGAGSKPKAPAAAATP